jgi:hypothetical protein
MSTLTHTEFIRNPQRVEVPGGHLVGRVWPGLLDRAIDDAFR